MISCFIGTSTSLYTSQNHLGTEDLLNIAAQQASNLLTKIDEMVRKNQQKFSLVKQLNLPIDQYAITGSGALGIRNLREIGDIDIIVTPALWNALSERYGVTDENSIKKVLFPGEIVEAFGEGSFYTEEINKDAPSIADRIAHAEIIEQLPFESLEHVLYYKRKMGRAKDLNDICLVEEIIAEKPCFEVRAIVNDIEQVKEKLSSLSAVFKSDYSFKDYIYYPKDRTIDLNKEIVRLRVYQKTNWIQQPVELAYKLKIFYGHSGSTKFKKQFNLMKETDGFLKNYTLAFTYSRTGFEYSMGNIKVFLEEIEGLAPSLELLSFSKDEISELLEELKPLQILSDSVPKLIENKQKQAVVNM